jgi:predicted RNA-binding Zn-ribbon protein involved in translation (DUF1610 family)
MGKPAKNALIGRPNERFVVISTQDRWMTQSLVKNESSSSFTKLGPRKKKARMDPEYTKEPEGYRIIDIRLLSEFLTSFPCPDCGGALILSEKSVNGLASKLSVGCRSQECEFEKRTYTSTCGGGGKSRYFNVNRQFVVAICAIGNNRTSQ